LIDPEDALAKAMRRLKAENADPAVWAAFAVYGTPTAK
jgi:hypothetical protein